MVSGEEKCVLSLEIIKNPPLIKAWRDFFSYRISRVKRKRHNHVSTDKRITSFGAVIAISYLRMNQHGQHNHQNKGSKASESLASSPALLRRDFLWKWCYSMVDICPQNAGERPWDPRPLNADDSLHQLLATTDPEPRALAKPLSHLMKMQIRSNRLCCVLCLFLYACGHDQLCAAQRLQQLLWKPGAAPASQGHIVQGAGLFQPWFWKRCKEICVQAGSGPSLAEGKGVNR